MERTIRITGEGKVNMIPDLIMISFDVRAFDEDYKTTIDKLNHEVEMLRNAIEENGLERKDLKTTNFTIEQDSSIDRYTREREFIGYRASHDLRIKFKLDQELINKVLVAVSKKLEHTDFNISYGSSQREKYEEELIKDAINQAKRMAKLMTQESGVQLKEILSIDSSFSELRFSSPRSSYSFSSEMMDSCRSAPDIEPEAIALKETVNVCWRIE